MTSRVLLITWSILLLLLTPSAADVASSRTIASFTPPSPLQFLLQFDTESSDFASHQTLSVSHLLSSLAVSVHNARPVLALVVQSVASSPALPVTFTQQIGALQSFLSTNTAMSSDNVWLLVGSLLLLVLLITAILIRARYRGAPSKHTVGMLCVFGVALLIGVSTADLPVWLITALLMLNAFAWYSTLDTSIFKWKRLSPHTLNSPGTAHIIALYLEEEECSISVPGLARATGQAMEALDPSELSQSTLTQLAAKRLERIRNSESGSNLVSGMLRQMQRYSGGDGTKITIPGIATVLFDMRDSRATEYAAKFMKDAIQFVEMHPEKASGSSCVAPPQATATEKQQN